MTDSDLSGRADDGDAKLTDPVASPGSARVYCQGCRRPSLSFRSTIERRPRADGLPVAEAETWTCRVCNRKRLRLLNVTDAEQLVQTILQEHLAARPNARALLDLDDFAGFLRRQLWEAFLRFDPSKGSFLGWATQTLRRRIGTYYREQIGRNPDAPKPHAVAVSIDASEEGADGGRLDGALSVLAGNAPPDRSPDLRRALAGGDSDPPRRDRGDRAGAAPRPSA